MERQVGRRDAELRNKSPRQSRPVAFH
jgi:hypothetical protein